MPLPPNADEKGRILKDQIDKAIEAKAEFVKVGTEIQQYAYALDHNFMYGDSLPADTYFKATVAKTAEYIEVVGPALYQNNPDRRVNPRPWATPEGRARAKVMQDYLNYTPTEGDLSNHSRRGINDALVFGGGVLWTGINTRKNCIQSVYDSIENLLLDPAAGAWDEMSWVGRKRKKPMWQMTGMFPDAKDKLAKMTEREPTAEVTYYVIYMRVGLYHLNNGKPIMDAEGNADQDDTPKKYTILEDGTLIDEDSWEIPFYLDDGWPCAMVSFREKPKCIWPVSPLQPGLGFQRALNYIYTFFMAKLKTASRDVIGFAKVNGEGIAQEDLVRIMRGIGLQYIPIDNSQEAVNISQLMQQWSFDPRANDFLMLANIVESAFEKATGLTDFISTGTTDKQFRSAAEAEMKDRQARTRFEDMRLRVEQWQSLVARREAQAARFLLSAQDIAPILGMEAAQVWGQLVPPMEVQEAELMDRARKAGLPPEQAAGYVEQNIQQGVIYEDWINEADYEIEAGSTRRKDISQQIDAANEFVRQALPALMQGGQVPAGLKGLAVWAKLNGMPQDLENVLNDAVDVAIAQQQAMMAQSAAMPPGAPAEQPQPGVA